MDHMELTITSELKNIQKIEKFLKELPENLNLKDCLRAHWDLAIVEAVNNALVHGNKLDARKKVIISAIKKNGKLLVKVTDQGAGFNIRKIPNDLMTEQLMETSGRGLYIMFKCTDHLFFHKGGREVIMTFLINKQ